MSENLAERVFTPEPEEHDQESICAIELNGQWVELVPGTLDLGLGDQGEVEFVAETPFLGPVTGVLSSITGLRSLPKKEEDTDPFAAELEAHMAKPMCVGCHQTWDRCECP